jgi:hypothetical protein
LRKEFIMRTITVLAVLTVALVIPATGATAPDDSVKGPGCGDITLWDPDQAGPPVYRSAPITGTPTVFASITTAKPSCSSLAYTVTVYDATGTIVLGTQTFNGDDATSLFQYAVEPEGGPSQVCVVATSSRNGRVVDAAPNSGCFPLSLDTSPGGSGLN